MPPDPPAVPLAQTLIAIRDATAQLGLLLRPELLENSTAKCAFDELVRSVSRSLSLAVDGSTSCGGKRKSSFAPYNERRICRRIRSQSYHCQKVLSETLDDGHSWRKYGQKDIQSAKYPRSYFRCTHKTDQGCKAMRQVQVSEEDPSRYAITYLGEHTCRDPPLVPQIINQSISFGIDCSENFKIEEAVVPQHSDPVPALNHEHCDIEEEVRSHLRFPFENDGDVTSIASMEVEFFMSDMDDFDA